MATAESLQAEKAIMIPVVQEPQSQYILQPFIQEPQLGQNGKEVYYYFDSDTASSNVDDRSTDGSLIINGFNRGLDKLILVDIDGTPMDLQTLIENNELKLTAIFHETTDGFPFQNNFILTGIHLTAQNPSDESGINSDFSIRLIWNEEDYVEVFDDGYYILDIGEKFLGPRNPRGADGPEFNGHTSEVLNDALLYAYFNEENFDDGIQLIASADIM